MKLIFTILFLWCGYYLSAQINIYGVINSYAQVTVVYYSCPDSLQVSSTSGFFTGDSILIIQMKGAVIDTSNSNTFGTISNYDKAGNYEFVKIGSITGNTIHLTTSLMRLYDINNNVQIISYPNYSKAVVTDTLTAQPWNGTTGGVLLFSVSDSLFLNADIDVSGKGFIGGSASLNYSAGWFTEFSFGNAPGNGGGKGEGVAAFLINKEYGRASQANGGGGGMDINTGAAGGSNYGAGGHGGNNYFAPDTLWGLRGISLDSGILQKKIFLGGGGGGGHQNDAGGTSGGNGGGIILIRSTVITGNNYFIKSNGADVTSFAVSDGAGGAGGGGSVLLNIANYNTNIFIEARGGKGGDQIDSLQCYGNGGGGGGGIILFSNTTIPVNVNTNVAGGAKGIGLCNNTLDDAANGDSGIVKFNWSVPKLVVANAGPDFGVCSGTQIQVGTSSQPGMQYQWDNGATGATPVINPLTSTIMVLTVTDGFCHFSYDTVNITVFPLPVISFTFNVNCNVVVFNNSSGINSYKWYFGDGDSSTTTSPSHLYLNSGNYQVNLLVRNNYGCSTSASQAITINSIRQSSMTVNNGACDSVFHFTNVSTNPVSSQWRFGDGDSSSNLNPYHTYKRTGNVRVQLITTSQNGCIDTLNQTISVVIKTPARFNYFVDSCASKIFFTNKSPSAISYNWDFGDNEISTLKNPVHNYHFQGEYNVRFTVNEGTVCPESTSVILTSPADGFYTLYIPNSFTPNGDGNNEIFKIFATIPCDTYSLVIFDRWGKEIFRTDDPLNIGWDGLFNGNQVANGLYVYYLKGTNSQKTGYILLNR